MSHTADKATKAFAFTGTRHGLTHTQRQSLAIVLRELWADGFTIAHIGAAIGADAEAADMCREIGFHIVAHPSTLVTQTTVIPCDELRDAAAALKRNRAMVRESELLVACPSGREPERGSGTWWTIGYASRRGGPVRYVWLDGTVS